MAVDPSAMDKREQELRTALMARKLQRIEEARALVEEANELTRDPDADERGVAET